MISGLGTGRCGTKSLAIQLGGLHEPVPWLEEEPVRYRCDHNKDVLEGLTANLKARSELDTPIIVDLKNSYVIDLICEIDPDATFIWMLRNPVDCISSLINGGAWTKTDWHGARNWRPFGGWPEDISREMRVVTYWIELNKLIEQSLLECGREFRLIQTESLTVWENTYAKRVIIKGDLLKLVQDTCYPLHKQWIRCHSKGQSPI